MTSRDFCYWLQGFFELEGKATSDAPESLSVDQVRCIRQHLAMVFKHEIDPSAGSAAHQAELNAIHEGKNLHLLTPEALAEALKEIEAKAVKAAQAVAAQAADGGIKYRC